LNSIFFGLVLQPVTVDDTFIDDLGIIHQHVLNPKVIMSAQLAVSMHYIGKGNIDFQ